MSEATHFDILAIAAHRDDVEQTCGGTLLKMAERGRRTASLLDVVAVGGNGENVEVRGLGHESYTRIATATPSRSGTMVVYQSLEL